ncbi:phage major capsid protein [Nocardioides sp. STR2]|uniref:Phage major capsid protein n=1 Tax=Nocardioides pini TaxID=2975053 RepID=A0ABT4CFG2_9ACTN|nr:phage major capsid protein [Nocardioides pini]MCY4726704.1 phage major capsid protein [Nocardioides pini]
MTIALAALESERNGILTEVRNIAAKAEEAGRGFTDDEQATVTERLAKAADVNTQISRLKAVSATTDEIDALMGEADAGDLNAKALQNARLGFGASRKSVGNVFTDSEGYKALMKAHNGTIAESAKGINMPAVQIGGFKDLLTGSDRNGGAGTLVENDHLGVVEYRAPAAGGIRDLVTVGSTGSDKVEYAQVIPEGVDPEGTRSGARGVYEATTEAPVSDTVTSTQAGVKPKSKMTFRKQSADVITVAHWMPATKRALSDVRQLRTLIDAFLRTGVAREFERQMLAGDRANPVDAQYEEFDGLLNMTGVQNTPWRGNVVATARRMIRQVRDKGGNLTAFAVSPAVNEAIDLLQDRQGRFFGNGPFSTGPQTLWGRPRVEVPDLGDDVILGGEWSTLVLWDREDTTLTATDSHEDFFVRNLVAVLAEARAAFGSLNPQLMTVGEVVDPEAPVYTDEPAAA